MEQKTEMQEQFVATVRRLLNDSPAALAMPPDVLQRLEKQALSQKRPAIDRMYNEADLGAKYNITRQQWRQYVRLLEALDGTQRGLWISNELAAALSMPTDHNEQVQNAGNIVVLLRIMRMVRRKRLTPEELATLAEAMAKENAALVRSKAQRLDELKFRHALRKELGANHESPAVVRQRLRDLYGITLPEPLEPEKGVAQDGAVEP